MSDSLVDRLRRWAHAVDAQPASDLMDEAADRIESLESLTRFQDRVIRSGNTAALTVEEREAVVIAMNATRYFAGKIGLMPSERDKLTAVLRDLLERLE